MEEYLTDLIDIETDVYDEDGAIVDTETQTDVKARIEDKNQLVKNKDGEEVRSNTFMMVDKDAKLSYDSRVKLKTQNGVDMPEPLMDRSILRLGKAHGFAVEFWRVWL